MLTLLKFYIYFSPLYFSVFKLFYMSIITPFKNTHFTSLSRVIIQPSENFQNSKQISQVHQFFKKTMLTVQRLEPFIPA